jgi:predicted transcriptional regulator of viral defense system
MDVIMETARQNNGIITSSMVTKMGISRGNLKYLVDKGMLEKVSRGVYVLPDEWEDAVFNLQARYKKGIISGETALFLFDLIDRTPSFCTMTFPASYNVSRPKSENIRCFQCKKRMV